MKNKKAAIELSINVLVVIIISIVIVGLGLVMFFQMRDKGAGIAKDLDQQTQDQLKALMLQNNYKVAVYPSQLTLDNGKSAMVGLGITNEFDAVKSFTITKNPVKFFPTPEQENTADWNLAETIKFNPLPPVNPKQQITPGILITMPLTAQSGEYVVTLQVSYTELGVSKDYGVVKIYIINP